METRVQIPASVLRLVEQSCNTGCTSTPPAEAISSGGLTPEVAVLSVIAVLLLGLAMIHVAVNRNTMISFLRNLFGSDSSNENDAVVGGAESVFNAIQENILGDKQYIAELGEPQLVDRGGQFSTDYMVLIPTFTESGDPNPPDLEYDLPDGEMGETANGLFDLLSYYGIDEISDLGKLRGESVAAEFEDGTLSLRFDELQEGEQ